MNRLALALACGLPLFGAERPAHAGTDYEFEAAPVHSGKGTIFGLAVGDFDGTNPGDEVACLVETGSVLGLVPGGTSWSGAVIHRGDDPIDRMDERPTLDVGDVLPQSGGDEVVVLGVDKVHVVFEGSEGWTSELAYDGSGLIGDWWGARVGDYDPSRPGEEVFMIHEAVFDFSNGFVLASVGGSWRETLVFSREVGMDSAVGEFNPDHPGPEIVVVTEMEPAYEVLPVSPDTGELWPLREIWNRPDNEDAGWVVKVGDVDPRRPGDEIAIGTRTSNRILVSSHEGNRPHRLETVLTGSRRREPRNIWDIALGDVLPGVGSLEIVGVDGSGSVYLVWLDGSTWRQRTIWRDQAAALHSVVVSDFDPSVPGNEILVGGTSGTLTLLSRSTPRFLRGDCNDDGAVDVSDVVFTLGSLFLGEGEPGCADACDSNDDGRLDISDPLATLGRLFLENRMESLLGTTECGGDLTDDQLDCRTFERCP